MEEKEKKRKKRRLFAVGERKKEARIRRNTDANTRKKCLSIDPSLISSNIFYRGGGELVNLVVTPFIFQSNIFIFLPREKEKVAALWRMKKRRGEGRGKEFTLVVSMCTRVLLTQRKTWRMKRKKKIYIAVVVCSLYVYTYLYTHTHTLLRLFRDTCSMWLF